MNGLEIAYQPGLAWLPQNACRITLCHGAVTLGAVALFLPLIVGLALRLGPFQIQDDWQIEDRARLSGRKRASVPRRFAPVPSPEPDT